MGSRTVIVSALLVALSVLAAPIPANAQESGGATPEKLWETDPSNVGPINDVAIDATGSIIAAVAADDGASNQQDGEVIAWDLTVSKTSSDPSMQPHDPNETSLTNPFAAEGMGVVALEPAPDSKANLLAAGQEGASGTDSRSNVFVYDIERGGNTAKQTRYSNDNQDEPTTQVEALRFSEDGRLLLSQHSSELALFKRSSGVQFNKIATWEQDGQEIIDVAATDDLGRIAVSTTEDPATGSDTYRLYVLKIDRTASTPGFTDLAGPEEPSGSPGQFNSVDISEDGKFVVAGTQNKVVYYYELQTNMEKDPDLPLNFSTPWTQQRSSLGAIGEVSIGERGTLFAAGYNSGHVVVFRQTRLPEEGPLAVAVQSEPFATGGAVQQLAWANKDTTLYAQASSLYMFNEIQFDPSKKLTPLWVIPNVRDVAISQDGNRFAVITGNEGQSVAAYEQRYEAQLKLAAPDELRPGEQTTLDLNITNTGSAFDEYNVSLQDVPGGWNTQIDPPRVSLLPGQSRIVKINVTPDQAQAPGTVPITLQASSRFAPGDDPAGERTVDLDIAEVHAAGLEVDDDTVAVTRTETSSVTFTLRNLGNTDDTFDLEVEQDQGWDVSIDGQDGTRASTNVSAAGSKEVTVSFDVPSSASEGSANEVTLEATPAGGGTSATATVTLLVEPDYGAVINGPEDTVDAEAGEQVSFTVTVRNTGNTEDTLTLKTFSNATNDLFWEARLSQPTLTLGGGADRDVEVSVNVPRGASPGDGTTVTVVARSAGSGEQAATASFDMAVPEESDDSPVALALVPLALLAAALLRRRP